ncbi:hypothetical protein GYMLUDRAFT_64959 [Collybiopsis luxurians FD-317 M1]|uniref:Uncharacterized protein n=1 Tax=Collybiopsis luxurians FD-317 M1 TaxID=944289 RepID=A0A0D0ALS8_9AGAR|nr:hypothetical protein GYMLUDRAFT_64959 [Collybiopsis luxurians FD-317 M1]
MDESLLIPLSRLSSLQSSAFGGYAPMSEDSVESKKLENFMPHLQHRTNETAQRPHFGTASQQRGLLTISSLFLLAVTVACMNHVAFSQLDGTETGSHTTQFWVTVLKNIFPTTVAILLLIGLKICLSQIALYRIRLGSSPLALVNLITSPPTVLNTVSILFKSSMRASILWFTLLAAITQAVTLTSIFIPGTLAVAPTPPHTQPLRVPTIDFSVVDSELSSEVVETGGPTTFQWDFINSSQRWQQLILRTALSNIAPTWDPPAGCGSTCTYTFSYLAPALNCAELSKKDIWPSGTNGSDSLLSFPEYNLSVFEGPMLNYFFYNSSFSTLTPLEIAFALLRGDFPNPAQWTPRGVHCTYQNATYKATTTFSNNTQSSSTGVKEWHGPISADLGIAVGNSTTNMSLAFLNIIQSVNDALEGNAYFNGGYRLATAQGTQAFYTPLFNFTSRSIQNLTSLGGPWTAFYFSLSSTLGGNLSAGLQSLLGNVTLAFVGEEMASTHADVYVTPNSTQYQYLAWRLGLIFPIFFGGSLVVVDYGLFCLRASGITAIFDLEHILEMTAASTGLHQSAVHPQFGSALVKGVFVCEPDGRLKRVALDVDRSTDY